VPGGPVHISVTQSGYDGELMMMPLPGVWSGVELHPGVSLVVFARSGSTDVAHVLSEPAITRVVPADTLLPGLHIAAQAEADDLPLARTLALAAPETSRLDPTFAEFLWARYGAQAMASQADFDALEDFAERKGLDQDTREALLEGGYDLVGLHGDETPQRAQRLALTMFRVLLMPDAADLHENLIDTYLPNLLGITSDLPPQSASSVFNGHQAERNAVTAFLHHHATDADATPLLTWLSAH